jgi:hypothetical protein
MQVGGKVTRHRARIDSKDSILRNRVRQPMYSVAWWAGTSNRIVVPAHQAGNRFLGPLKGLKIPAQVVVSVPVRKEEVSSA